MRDPCELQRGACWKSFLGVVEVYILQRAPGVQLSFRSVLLFHSRPQRRAGDAEIIQLAKTQR
jgi:hypothetical protein